MWLTIEECPFNSAVPIPLSQALKVRGLFYFISASILFSFLESPANDLSKTNYIWLTRNRVLQQLHPTNPFIPLADSIEQIERLIDQGRYLEARSKMEKALTTSQELRLKQLYALSLSKSGVPEAALEYMEPVYQQHPDDPESAGILGSICKELFKKNQSNPFAVRSRDTYLKNFNSTKNYYTGINAASMSVMAGQVSKGREIATEIISLLDGKPGDFWTLITLGEAHLLTKNKLKSIEYYVQARQQVGIDWGRVTSVYRQLWLLNHFLPVPNDIMKLFSPPRILSFVGHMIDSPQRKEPRFPASIELQVKEAIRHSIRSMNAQIGYCSLACGGDILFAEVMSEEGGEVNIYLPCDKEDFIKTSVEFAGPQWVDRFNALLEKFPVTYVSEEPYGGQDDIYPFQTRIIYGASVLRSASYHNEPALLTVLSDIDPERKEGGTRHTLGMWPFPKQHTNINPDIYRPASRTPVKWEPTIETEQPAQTRPILHLAYVDLTQVAIHEREKIMSYRSEEREPDTYLIYEPNPARIMAAFPSVSATMDFVRFVTELLKLARNPIFRICLHAGPIYIESSGTPEGPVLSGKAVQLVREMCLITALGAIFASDHVAALLALERIKPTIEYAGIFNIPGGDHRTTIYRLE
jgi:tetratricopeptide (TPR) repeat protein